MRIAIINNLYEPFARGGAEVIAKFQFEGLKNKDHKVITISLKPYNSIIRNSVDHYYLCSIFSNLNKFPKFLRLFWHLWDIFNFINFFKIKKILKTNKIDTVITHNLTGIGKITLFFIAKHYKHIHVLHDIALLHPSGLMLYGNEKIINSPFSLLFQKISRFFIKRSSVVISPSNWLFDLHLQKGLFKKNKFIVLPNPVARNGFQDITTKSDDYFDFLYVGLISRTKGVDVLLQAFSQLMKINKKIKLTLAGEISDKNIIKTVNKNKNIAYLGKLEHKLIFKAMQRSDCLLVPSICYENSPTVIYEAMSQGLFVISSNIGGSKELINKFGGLVFEPNNSKDLLRRMKWVIKNSLESKRIGEDSELILKEYNLKSYINKLEFIINH